MLADKTVFRAICYVKTVSFNSKFLFLLLSKCHEMAYCVSAYFVASFFTMVT